MSELLVINQRLEHPVKASTSVTLPFEHRQKSRLRVTLDDGREGGMILPRGHVLRGGDCLKTEDGTVINVVAADEPVTTVTHTNTQELARAAYHLGNRHVALQVGDGWLRYLTDHVLDEMVVSLGMTVSQEQAPFEPESGAYHGHGHSHSHSHEHTEIELNNDENSTNNNSHSTPHEHSHSH